MFKDFISKKAIGFWFFVASFLFALLAVIVYGARGGDVLTKLSGAVIALFVVGLVINVGLAVKDIQPLEILPFVFYLIAFAVFMDTEIDFIGNVAMGIDGNSFDGAFIFIIVASVLAVALGMAAAILKIEKEPQKTENKSQASNA